MKTKIIFFLLILCSNAYAASLTIEFPKEVSCGVAKETLKTEPLVVKCDGSDTKVLKYFAAVYAGKTPILYYKKKLQKKYRLKSVSEGTEVRLIQ